MLPGGPSALTASKRSRTSTSSKQAAMRAAHTNKTEVFIRKRAFGV